MAPHPTLIVFVSDNNQGKVDMQTAKDLLSKMLESAPKKTEIMEMFAARVQVGGKKTFAFINCFFFVLVTAGSDPLYFGREPSQACTVNLTN